MAVTIYHDLYYKLCNGKYVSDMDMKTAYEITTGKQRMDSWRIDHRTTRSVNSLDPEYSKWLYNLLGKTVIGVCHEGDVPLEELIRSNSLLMATKTYRSQHGCGLREAHEAVSEMRREYKKNNL